LASCGRFSVDTKSFRNAHLEEIKIPFDKLNFDNENQSTFT